MSKEQIDITKENLESRPESETQKIKTLLNELEVAITMNDRASATERVIDLKKILLSK